MATSFRVYIDESGDEGFTFLPFPEKGSPEWFVLSAFIVRHQDDAECVHRLNEFRSRTNRKKDVHVHWRKLKHTQKVLYASIIAGMDATGCSVAVHKPSLREVQTFQQKDVLYFYAARYLVERVSWFVRDNCIIGDGDGKAELWFSKRKNLSYSDLLNYLFQLKCQQEAGYQISIDFSHLEMDADKVHVRSPGQRAGLQLVDAWAGATFNALETDVYGNREARYANIINPLSYRHRSSAKNYGLKVMPNEGWDFIKGECGDGTMEEFWERH